MHVVRSAFIFLYDSALILTIVFLRGCNFNYSKGGRLEVSAGKRGGGHVRGGYRPQLGGGRSLSQVFPEYPPYMATCVAHWPVQTYIHT